MIGDVFPSATPLLSYWLHYLNPSLFPFNGLLEIMKRGDTSTIFCNPIFVLDQDESQGTATETADGWSKAGQTTFRWTRVRKTPNTIYINILAIVIIWGYLHDGSHISAKK